MSPKKAKTTSKPVRRKAPSAGRGGKPAPKGKKKAPLRNTKKTALAPRKQKKPKLPVAPVAEPAENPAAKALAHKIAKLVLDKKALDVVILDVRGKTSYADYFVVASGESERQVSAMAENVVTTIKRDDGVSPIGHEGMDVGSWVLVDYGEVVAHLFFTEVRGFYDLEGLWADAKREQVA